MSDFQVRSERSDLLEIPVDKRKETAVLVYTRTMDVDLLPSAFMMLCKVERPLDSVGKVFAVPRSNQSSFERDLGFERLTKRPNDSTMGDPHTDGIALDKVLLCLVKDRSSTCSESRSIRDLVVGSIALLAIDGGRDRSLVDMGTIDKEVGLGVFGRGGKLSTRLRVESRDEELDPVG
jgi:hypothetical protein